VQGRLLEHHVGGVLCGRLLLLEVGIVLLALSLVRQDVVGLGAGLEDLLHVGPVGTQVLLGVVVRVTQLGEREVGLTDRRTFRTFLYAEDRVEVVQVQVVVELLELLLPLLGEPFLRHVVSGLSTLWMLKT
jgi:hypothetical protein